MLKKKTILLLAALVLCIIIGQVYLNSQICQGSQDTTKSAEQNDEKESAEWSFYDSNLDEIKGDAQFKLIKQFLIAVFFVVILGIGAFYFSRKLVPRFTTTKGKNISLIETIHLGPHKTLHLLEVGDKQKLLIGSTNESINILADVTESLSSSLNSEILDNRVENGL